MGGLTIQNGGLWNGERQRAATGTEVVQVLKLARDRWLVREDYYKFPHGRSNVYCVTDSLDVVWSVELPASDDVFCNDAELIDGKLFVWTWSCYRCEVDPQSGRLLAKQFTK